MKTEQLTARMDLVEYDIWEDVRTREICVQHARTGRSRRYKRDELERIAENDDYSGIRARMVLQRADTSTQALAECMRLWPIKAEAIPAPMERSAPPTPARRGFYQED